MIYSSYPLGMNRINVTRYLHLEPFLDLEIGLIQNYLDNFRPTRLERYKMEAEVKIYKLALRVCELIREMGVYVGMRFQRRALLKYTQACAAALQFMEEVREVDLPRWRLDTRCSIINQDFGFLLEADNRY